MEKNEIYQQLIARLDALAAKLGIAAQAIWGFYVRQAFVDGVFNLIWTVLMLGLLVAIGIYAKRFVLWDIRQREHGATGGILTFIFGMVTLVVLILFYLNAYYALTAFYNPGYWAFTHLTQNLIPKSN